MAAPWAGAFDGIPWRTSFAADDADESAEIVHGEEAASSDGSVEMLHEAEVEEEVKEETDVSGMSFSGPRSPAVADAEESTEALHRALAETGRRSLRDDFASTRPRTSLRDDFASTRPRTSPLASSPAAAAAEDATEELHRALAGNDPIATLRATTSLEKFGFGDARRRSDASSDATDSSAEEVATEGAPTPRAGVTSLALDESAASEVATEGRPTPRASTAPRYSETFESEGAWGEDGFRPDAGPGPGLGSPRPPPAFPNLGPAEMDDEEAEILAIAASVRAIRRGEGAAGEASRTLRTLLRRVQADAANAGLAAAPLDEGVAVNLARSSTTTRAPLSFEPSRGVSGEASKPPSAAAAGLAAMALADAWPSTRASPPAARGATRASLRRGRGLDRVRRRTRRVPRARDRRTRTLGGVRGVGGGSSGRRRRRRRLFCRRTRRRFRRTSSGRRRYSERRSTGRCARGSRRYARVCEPPFAVQDGGDEDQNTAGASRGTEVT